MFRRVVRRDWDSCGSMDGVEAKDVGILVESLTAALQRLLLMQLRKCHS